MNRYLTATLPILFGASSMFGAWQKIDDFQGNLDAWLRDKQPQTLYFQNPDPFNPENLGFYMNPNTHGVDYGDSVFLHALPDGGIPKGSTGTVYFRFWQEGGSNNVHFGITGVPTVLDDDGFVTEPGSYGRMSAQINVSALDGTFQVRDGTRTIRVPAPERVPDNTWYEFWVYMKHDSDTYEVYYKTSGMSEPGHVQIPEYGPNGQPTGNLFEDALYRNVVTGPLLSVMIECNANDPANPTLEQKWLVDDIYVDLAGKNITSPVSIDPVETWAGYPILPNGNVNTSAFLGWIYPSGDFVWVYDLEAWVYLPESHVGAEGAWAYAFK